MKPASAALVTFLQTTDQFLYADLFTITLADGTALFYTTSDVDIVFNGHTYLAGSPLVERDQIKWQTGLEVDTLSLSIKTQAADVVEGAPVLQDLAAGKFDDA